MKIEIRQRDRRAILVLAVALLAYGLISRVLLPQFSQLREAAGDMAQKEEQLKKYRRAIVRKGRYSQMLEQARKNAAEAEGHLIRGDNASLASVELQTIVEDISKRLEIPLGPRSVTPARKRDEFFNEITMALSLDCTPNQLATFLSEIRMAPKFVIIRSAQVQPARIVSEAPKNEDFVKTLHVNLTLSAILSTPSRKG